MIFEDTRPGMIDETPPRPEPEVSACAEQRRFEAACARELRGDQD